MSSLSFLISLALLTFASFPLVNAHGFPSWPRSRGMLGTNTYGLKPLKPDANTDYCPHCLNGGGTGTVAENIPDGVWTPYEPTNPNFRFRDDHGICGDPKGNNDHMAPHGTFYEGFNIATYEEEDYMDMETHINAHHNGFMEFFICNIDCCSTPDISKQCFQEGCCKKLMRVPHQSCESGYDRICGPVDPKHPGRWYLPPRNQDEPTDNWYGGLNKKMRYALPKGMTCEKCVVHWSWTTANSCNPPGFDQYNFPQKWDGIPGDGGSVGSINKAFSECGSTGAPIPEEFWTCSEDIRIVPKNEGKSRTLQIFRDGDMNIEGPHDSTSDMLLKPLQDPAEDEEFGEQHSDADDQIDPTNGDQDPPAAPTSTPTPTSTPPNVETPAALPADPPAVTGKEDEVATPTPTSTPPPAETPAALPADPPAVTGKEDEVGDHNFGSKYDLASYFQTYDTGVCVKAPENVSYCEACIDLGYGTVKCMWCAVDEAGTESCLHKKPEGY